MRILMVSDRFPWPVTGGGFMRLDRTVEALSGLGEIDLFYLAERGDRPRVVPPGIAISRLGSTPYPEPSARWRWRAAWLTSAGMPLEIAVRHFDRTPGLALRSWAADHYDLVWFLPLAPYEWMGRPDLGPTVVDLDNLESEKETHRAELMRATDRGRGWMGRTRRSIAVAQARFNARDWEVLQRSTARRADRVVLCSALDVRRSGIGDVEVIPNTYRRPERPLGRMTVGDPPVVLFQGSLEYGPNADAASWLVRDLAPLIRSRVPGTEIRLVGTTTPGLAQQLHDPPAVTVVGRVPSMDPELGRADLVAVPLRSGSGTRLKIIESFAHRIPVVSTSLGAEGLDIEDGVHFLGADDPGSFAAACERLLTDVDLRRRMVDAAEQRYLERYEWTLVREKIRQVARDVAATRE